MLTRSRVHATAVLALGMVACGSASYSSTSSSSSSTASSSSAVVTQKNLTVSGKREAVLADAKGLTLYYFRPDTASKVTCTGACESTWPALTLTSGTPQASGLPGTLSTIDGPNGRQVLYNGHPLYRFAKDKDSGDAYGEGVLREWFVATPGLTSSGSAPAPASPSPSPQNSSPSYGY